MRDGAHYAAPEAQSLHAVVQGNALSHRIDQRGFALVVSVGQGQAFIGNGGGEGEVAEGKNSSQLLRRSLETLASAGH